MSKPHTEDYERAPQGANGSESSQAQHNNHALETSEGNSGHEQESIDSQSADHTNGNGTAKQYQSAEDNGHQREASQSETSGPGHHEKQVEQSKQPSKDDTPKTEKDKVVDQAKKDYEETKESVNKAKDTLKDLVSGKANIVDAAFAIKGAIDAVQGLTGKLSSAAMMPVMKALSAFKGQAVLPAGKQMDPVMGIDVHMVTIPPSPAPVPLPHPYIGILFNPKDFISCAINTVKPAVMAAIPEPAEDAKPGIATSLAKNKDAIAGIAMGIAGLSASVKFGSFIPRAVTGTPTKNIPHIPMGAGFHPAFVASVAKNHGKAFLGSLFVAADGDPMVGSFHLHYDCWDVGIVDLFKGLRKGTKKAEPGAPLAQLYVPSGTVLPIPWGKPVLVNSIPTPINPLALLDKLFKAGLGKLKAAGRKAAQKGLDKLTGKVGCGALTKVSKLIGTGQSHPVDVAEGHFYTDNIDFSLPGPIPLVWERTWYSYSDYKGPLGYGWHHSYDMALAVDEETGMAALRMSDGRVTGFKLPSTTEGTYNRSEKLALHFHDDGFYYVIDNKGLIYRFTKHEYKNPYNKTRAHLLQSVANRNGFAIRLAYNEEGLLIWIIDSAGRRLSVNNDDNGRITTIDAPHPELRDQTFAIAKYSYTPEGDMSHHYDALNQAMSFHYDNHLMVKEIWRNGLNWHFQYDKKRGTDAKCIEVWGDDDLLHYKFDYSNAEYTVVINSLGHRKIFYHKNGVVIKYVDPRGESWIYRYNKFNELQSETDPLDNQQSYTYDQWGNLTSIQDPLGSFIQFKHNHADSPYLVTNKVDAIGGEWQWVYDEKGNVIETTDPAGAKSIYEYNDGSLAAVIHPTKARTKLTYDYNQNLTSIENENGAVTQYTYDILGNCIEVANPNGKRQKRSHDLNGRLRDISDFDDNAISMEYDGLDNLTRYLDKHKDLRYTYYGFGKLASRTSAGATIYFNYDTEQQLNRIVNERGLPYVFQLDDAGNVTEETGFDGARRQYHRNAAGRVTQVFRPGGKITVFDYDACGRITEVNYSDAKKEIYKYREDGQLTSATNENAEVIFERDILGNIVKEWVNKEWVSSEYSVISNRVKVASSLGASIVNEYNDLGQLLEMRSNGWMANFNYDKAGFEVSRGLPGHIRSEWQRDRIGRPVSHMVTHRDGHKIQQRKLKKYLWDANDRITQIKDQIGITKFEHDLWSNLSKTIFSNGDEQLRNPDEQGNLFKSVDRNDREYSNGGQLRKANGYLYRYDLEGNLIEKKMGAGKIWRYEWNDAGMLTKVIRPDCAEVTFTYDALRRRLSKQYKNTITKFVWDCNVPLHEWKEHAKTGEKLSDITVGKNEIITWLFDNRSFAPCAKFTGDTSYSIVTDHLGTATQMYKADGSLFWDCELDSYGKIRLEKGSLGSCPFRYQGQYEDAETELYYNRFRYYAANEGIYISQDPIGIAGSNRTLYAYVVDTNIWLDPFGLDCWSTARKKFWKAEAKKNPHLYSPNNIARMKDGKAPRMTVEVINRHTGEVSIKDYSLELHHATIPQREGGPGVHDASNLEIMDPWKHEENDDFRHVGYEKESVKKGVDTW